jgi:integrase
MPRLSTAKPLNANALDAEKPGADRRELRDSASPGLSFVIQTTGTRSWALRLWHGGKFRKITLGQFPTMTLAAARDRARDVRADPNAAIEAKRQAATGQADADLIAAVWDEYKARHLSTIRESSADRFTAIFETHILPKWKNRRATEISKRDVLNIVDDASKRGPSAANSTITVLSSFFNWAVGRDIVAASPVVGVKKSAEESRERVLADGELKTIWAGCDKLGFVFGPMFQLLLLTGARRNEVAEMTLAEVNLKDRIWTIPAARTKNGVEHRIYLSDAAKTLIEKLPRIAGCKFLFSTTGDSASSGFSKAKATLDKLAKADPWRLHDFRRTAATGMARLGIPLATVEKALNHTSGSFGGIVGTYQRHTFAEETKVAFEAWGGFVQRLVAGDAANVVPMIRA